MIRSKLMKVLFISACVVTFTSTSPILASAAEVQGQSAAYEGSQQIDNKLYEKQQEIDRYVFEDHAKEIEGMGFQVTSTFAAENYVEIGITPYSEANAEYLYKAFGKEQVKVVKGEIAVLLNEDTVTMQAPDSEVSNTNASQAAETGMADTAVDDSRAADTAVTDGSKDVEDSVTDASQAADTGVIDDTAVLDTPVKSDVESAEMEITIAEDANNNVTSENSEVDPEVLAYTTGEAVTETDSNSWIPVVFACAAGMTVIIGGTAFWIQKRKNFRR